MKRINILFCLFIFSIPSLFSQIYVDNEGNVYDQRKKQTQQQVKSQNKTSSSFDKSKLEFGGNLGLQFGDYTLVNFSPQVGYKFSRYISAGAGIGYSYYNYDKHNTDYTEHFASFNLYANLYPIDFLILSIKPEISRMWLSEEIGREKFSDEQFVPSVVLGGGVRFGNLTMQIHYDVVQDKYSPYGDKIFYSVGYTFGF